MAVLFYIFLSSLFFRHPEAWGKRPLQNGENGHAEEERKVSDLRLRSSAVIIIGNSLKTKI